MKRTVFCLIAALAFSVVAPLASAETTSAVAAFEKDRTLADEGDVEAQFRLGSRYEKGEGVPRDVMKAIGWYQRAADNGSVKAQINLGGIYMEGAAGVRRNYAEAKRWYLMAAEHGSAFAQFNLGLLYEQGWGASKDEAQALQYYLLAAKQGDDQASRGSLSGRSGHEA